MTRAAEVANKKVYPSGAARATAWVPTRLAAPGRFSTTNCCPSARESFSAMTRHSTSGLLPAACGTTNVTGRCGQDCADTGLARQRATPASSRRRDSFGMVILPKNVRLAISDRLRRRLSRSGFVGDAVAQDPKAIDFHLDD